MAKLVEMLIIAFVALTVAGYMFGPAVQGWVTANTTGSTNVDWVNLTIIPILIGVVAILAALDATKSGKRR